MPARGTIAVVVSTYNQPAILALVLDGYRRQGDTDIHLYVADDGSDRRTADLIEAERARLPFPITHVWQEDRGFRKARIHNRTLKRLREPYVLFTDGDCIPTPGLVAAHRRFAAPGALISGRRVLIARALTQSLCERGLWAGEIGIGRALAWRLRGQINRLLPLILPPRLGPPQKRLTGIRGCHLSCWLDDLKRVNGFDEAFEGWGREDSDLVARLFHAGIVRRNLIAPPVLHLWHAEQPRGRLDENDRLLQDCLRSRRVRAIKGLAELED